MLIEPSGLIVAITEPHSSMACWSSSWGRLPAYLPFVLLESRRCNYPHLTWPSLAFPSLGHDRTFGPVLFFFLMPVCTLVVDIWLRRKAEHSANSVIIQCCGTERCNSQSPLAHRSNCVIRSSTGVIAHRHTPADARHSEASFLCLFLYLGTHKDDPRVQTLIFSESFVGRGKKGWSRPRAAAHKWANVLSSRPYIEI